MKVMNIGIIIRNDHGDTFPVALTSQMVGIIQNLLTQIPAATSKIVDGSGNQVASQASIPIIPRPMEFDWDEAYSPIMPEEEQKMMKDLKDRYESIEKEKTENPEAVKEEGGIIVPEGIAKEDDPEDKVIKLKPVNLNPFNLQLDAKISSSDDSKEAEREDDAETAGAGAQLPVMPPANQAKAAKEAALEDEKVNWGTHANPVSGEEAAKKDAEGDCTVSIEEPLQLDGKQKPL